MAYVALTSIHNPSVGGIAPAAWGDQVHDNLEFLVRVPACSAYHSTTQSVTTGTTPAFWNMDSENFDNASMHSTSTNTSRITVPVSGNYRASGTIQWAANATGNRSLCFRINGAGTNYFASLQANTGGTNSVYMNGTRTFGLTANDYLEIGGWQNSGGNLNVTVQDFCVELISL